MGAKTRKKESVPDKQGLIVRRTAKDSVFCNLFSDKRYLLQLYQALHPEDTETTEDDLTDITIRNVLTDGIYNDVGFRNKDKVIILTEAQSTWSMNILIRMLLYLAETYHDYFRVICHIYRETDESSQIYFFIRRILPWPSMLSRGKS